ncbi:hypothetical protein Tco_0655283 [Tanacetum coccineum]|uniref:Uncharacterized protein n=1 Tax=Tanacetum coccineum TaxID=301880 RepID=A0ABQ4X5L1_9ASTR
MRPLVVVEFNDVDFYLTARFGWFPELWKYLPVRLRATTLINFEKRRLHDSDFSMITKDLPRASQIPEAQYYEKHGLP